MPSLDRFPALDQALAALLHAVERTGAPPPRWTDEYAPDGDLDAAVARSWLSAQDAKLLLRAAAGIAPSLVLLEIACACARDVLVFVPASEPLPARAVGAAERVLRGEAGSAEACAQLAREVARKYSIYAGAHATAHAAHAASHAAGAVGRPLEASDAAARAAAAHGADLATCFGGDYEAFSYAYDLCMAERADYVRARIPPPSFDALIATYPRRDPWELE